MAAPLPPGNENLEIARYTHLLINGASGKSPSTPFAAAKLNEDFNEAQVDPKTLQRFNDLFEANLKNSKTPGIAIRDAFSELDKDQSINSSVGVLKSAVRHSIDTVLKDPGMIDMPKKLALATVTDVNPKFTPGNLEWVRALNPIGTAEAQSAAATPDAKAPGPTQIETQPNAAPPLDASDLGLPLPGLGQVESLPQPPVVADSGHVNVPPLPGPPPAEAPLPPPVIVAGTPPSVLTTPSAPPATPPAAKTPTPLQPKAHPPAAKNPAPTQPGGGSDSGLAARRLPRTDGRAVSSRQLTPTELHANSRGIAIAENSATIKSERYTFRADGTPAQFTVGGASPINESAIIAEGAKRGLSSEQVLGKSGLDVTDTLNAAYLRKSLADQQPQADPGLAARRLPRSRDQTVPQQSHRGNHRGEIDTQQVADAIATRAQERGMLNSKEIANGEVPGMQLQRPPSKGPSSSP